ncbi:hypothetical protein [Paraglaciecola chathamensis]|uniref:hypothetical protein n=1 Tax=Paraglaciecola chathamensis TaxID=368405 RepID=UPI0036386AF9
MKVKVKAPSSNKVNSYDNVTMINTDLNNRMHIYYTDKLGTEREVTYNLNHFKDYITIEA